jgi:hypothetical protein
MMEDKSSTGDPEIPGGGTSNISDAPQADDPTLDTRAYGETASSVTEDTGTTVKGDPEIPGGGNKVPGGGGS